MRSSRRTRRTRWTRRTWRIRQTRWTRWTIQTRRTRRMYDAWCNHAWCIMHYQWLIMWPRIPLLDVRNASKTFLIKVSKPCHKQPHKISTLWRPLPSRQRPWKWNDPKNQEDLKISFNTTWFLVSNFSLGSLKLSISVLQRLSWIEGKLCTIKDRLPFKDLFQWRL